MDRKPVESTNIKSVGYDPQTLTLEVEFKSKGNPVWQYQPISQDGYNELLKAESIGEYFHKNIKTNDLVSQKKIS